MIILRPADHIQKYDTTFSPYIPKKQAHGLFFKFHYYFTESP